MAQVTYGHRTADAAGSEWSESGRVEGADPSLTRAPRNLVAHHETLVSRETEIENLKLLILKPRRMRFGRKSETTRGRADKRNQARNPAGGFR